MEPYVRAAAYKCLQRMIEINELWNNLLESENGVIDYLVQALHQETEGIVRKEIAGLIAALYEFQEIPEEKLSDLYDIMSHAVMIDLYWEVKVKALEFWHKVLERHLMDQGVIDGTFPKITFSKEHRKIVTLNEVEIKKRLIKVLKQLSETGCLAAFISALEDDCDVEVSKTAVNFMKNFVNMLKQFNVCEEKSSVSYTSTHLNSFSTQNSPLMCATPNSIGSPYSTASPHSQLSDQSCFANRDAIIDEILDVQDMKLLESVFNSTDTPVKNSLEIRSRMTVSPKLFLDKVSNNFESSSVQKAQWIQDIDNFNSLLDDILCEYEPSEINNMDCY